MTTDNMGTLRVYRNDIVEWVVAESPEEATRIMVDENHAHYDDPPEWIACDSHDEWTLQEGPDAPKTRTFGGWIETNGRGFLGTTEY